MEATTKQRIQTVSAIGLLAGMAMAITSGFKMKSKEKTTKQQDMWQGIFIGSMVVVTASFIGFKETGGYDNDPLLGQMLGNK